MLARFVSSDINVPGSSTLAVAFPKGGKGHGPSNPQALNRYSYVLNNSLKSVDPSGHYPAEPPYDPNRLLGPEKDVGTYSAMVHSTYKTLQNAIHDPAFHPGLDPVTWILKVKKD